MRIVFPKGVDIPLGDAEFCIIERASTSFHKNVEAFDYSVAYGNNAMVRARLIALVSFR